MIWRYGSEVVTATLEQADIPVEGLFPNADAGFDSKDFRKSCGNKEINAIYTSTNAMEAWRTGTGISTRDFTTNDIWWNAPTHGWTAIAHCQTGSIPPRKARYTIIIKPDSRKADGVAKMFSKKQNRMDHIFKKAMTCDNGPRKVIGYKTPREIMDSELKNVA